MAVRVWSKSTVAFGSLAVAILVSAAGPAAAQSANEMEQAVRQIFERFDANSDGNITDAEFMQAGKRDFAALDTNSDLVVSEKEFLDPKSRGIDQLDSTQLAQARDIWSQQFAGLDADKNSKLTATEHASFEQRSFESMDGNKDGEITLAEMTAVVSQK
jgi:Ca2+-binding EF-hand superfamily protein